MFFYNIAANDFLSSLHKVKVIKGTIQYYKTIEKDEKEEIRADSSDTILLNKLFLENRKGDRWECCNLNAPIGIEKIRLELQNIPCNQH